MITKKLLSLILCGFVLFALFVVSCSEDRTFTSYETHPDGWMNPASEEFHGQAAIPTGAESCGGCHYIEPDPLGYQLLTDSYTTTEGTCRDCHWQYPHLWENAAADHQNVIHHANWNLQSCTECHGVDFAGANTGVSCLQCHTEPAGVADCNLCHAQPPVDDAGLPATFLPGAYGAHARHVIDKGYACTECHASVNDLAHANGAPAEVSFAEALIATAKNSEPNFIYGDVPEQGNGGCSSVYCHGNGLGGPSNQGTEAISWLNDVQLNCQSCHATPPTSPNHPANGRCHECHPTMDPASEDYAILAELDSLHVNGVINVIFE